MLELVVGPENGIIENASIPIRWCINEETLNLLDDIENPHILIRFMYEDGYNEDRFVEKISKYMGYFPCRRSGKVKIEAYIVTGLSTIKSIKHIINKTFLDKSGSTYSYGLKHRSKDNNSHINIDNGMGVIIDNVEEPYTITIPKDVFGAELPKWIKICVNRYLENQTVDECHRNRRLMSFPLRAPFILCELLFISIKQTIFYTVCILLGFFKLDISRYLRPFADGYDGYELMMSDVLSKNVIKNFYNYFLKKLSNNNNSYFDIKIVSCMLSTLLLPFVPVIYIIYVILGNILIINLNLNILLLPLLPFILNILVIIGIAIFIGICFALYNIGGFFIKLLPDFMNIDISFDPFFDFIDKIAYKIINMFTKKQELKKELLTCNGDANSVTTDIKRIPLREQSITLIYSNIKNKVCKPMMR